MRKQYNLGYICIEQGDIENAIKYFEHGVKLEPNNQKFKLEMAFAFNKLGDLNSSLNLYEQVINMGDNINVQDMARALKVL